MKRREFLEIMCALSTMDPLSRDVEGSEARSCARVPGIADDLFNCWCGGAAGDNFPSARVPSIVDLDHGRVQLEFWYMSYVTGAPAWGASGYRTVVGCPETGNWPTDTEIAIGARFDDTPNQVHRGDNVGGGWGGAAVITRTINPPDFGWHYYVIDYDDGDQMYTWIDGVLVHSDGAWVAVVSGGLDFLPLIGSGGVGATYDEWHSVTSTDYAFPHIHGRLGPVAVYEQNRCTEARQLLAFRNKHLCIPEDAVLAYDWRQVYGATGWEEDRDNIIRGVSEVPEIPIATPTGTDGDVYVHDISGNGNHLYLRTRARYSTDVNATWGSTGIGCCALGIDPFFR